MGTVRKGIVLICFVLINLSFSYGTFKIDQDIISAEKSHGKIKLIISFNIPWTRNVDSLVLLESILFDKENDLEKKYGIYLLRIGHNRYACKVDWFTYGKLVKDENVYEIIEFLELRKAKMIGG